MVGRESENAASTTRATRAARERVLMRARDLVLRDGLRDTTRLPFRFERPAGRTPLLGASARGPKWPRGAGPEESFTARFATEVLGRRRAAGPEGGTLPCASSKAQLRLSWVSPHRDRQQASGRAPPPSTSGTYPGRAWSLPGAHDHLEGVPSPDHARDIAEAGGVSARRAARRVRTGTGRGEQGRGGPLFGTDERTQDSRSHRRAHCCE